MLKSESIKAIAPALRNAQLMIKGAVKDATNPHLRSKYADLASVMEACKGPLNHYGITIVQGTQRTGGGSVTVFTTLLHESGEWIGCELELRPVKDDPQGIGSAITYGRRYTLSAITGVCPEDDDGHAASHGAQPPRPLPTSGQLIHVGRESTITIGTTASSVTVSAEPAGINTRVVKPSAASLKERKEAAMAKLIKSIGAEKADATLAELKAKNNGAKTTKDAQAIVDALETLTKDLQ
jgi:hypothetical protein